MKRVVCVGLAVIGCLSFTSPVAAQQVASDTWQVTIAPYLMGAAIGGDVGIGGLEAEIDMPASDVFANLEFGAMGIFAARKGNWGVGSDVIFMALGETADRPAADLDFNQTAVAVYGLRRLNDMADASFGVRINGLDGGLTFKEQSVVPAGTTLSRSKWWADPIVGLRLHSSSARRVNATLYTEIGGFGVGSDLTWQISPVVDVRVSERMSLDVGYRWLSIDYEDGDGAEQFTWDTLTQGPVLGFKFRF